MLLSKYPPTYAKHLPLDPLCVSVLPLVREIRRQIARTRQRVGMLLSKHPPTYAKHLPLDPLCINVLPLVRERRGQIARTRQRVC